MVEIPPDGGAGRADFNCETGFRILGAIFGAFLGPFFGPLFAATADAGSSDEP